jgi:hypothetical protein
MGSTLTSSQISRPAPVINQWWPAPFLLWGIMITLIGFAIYLLGILIALLSFAVLFPIALLGRRAGSMSALLLRVRLALIRSKFERCVIVVALYFWFAAAVATATVGKLGASDNYFLELDLAACLISGLFLGWLVRRVSFRPCRSYVLPEFLIIFIFLMQSASNIGIVYGAAMAFSRPTPNYSQEVVRFIRELPGPVYS